MMWQPVSIFSILAAALVPMTAVAQQPLARFPLRRFEVIRADSDGLRRLPPSVRAIFVDPVPDGRPVESLDAAAKNVGFVPRLPKSTMAPEVFVIDPVSEEAKIQVADLNGALSQAGVRGVAVPPLWDGAVLRLQQNAGVLADYGDFFIAQAPPLTLTTPERFPLEQFLEVLFRIVGINAPQARSLRDKFAAAPASFFPIPSRYEMDIREVPIASGSGLLLQNADKSGELMLMWSSPDRTYVLSGLMSEAQAIATANSLQ